MRLQCISNSSGETNRVKILLGHLVRLEISDVSYWINEQKACFTHASQAVADPWAGWSVASGVTPNHP